MTTTCASADTELVDIIFARVRDNCSILQFIRHTKRTTRDGFRRNDKYSIPSVLEVYERGTRVKIYVANRNAEEVLAIRDVLIEQCQRVSTWIICNTFSYYVRVKP